VWALGFVSLLMDASSELVHSLLPVFLVSTLGASVATIGLLEGLAEAVASVVKVFAGALSDRWGKRKALVVAGYGLAALSKPLFPLAPSVGWIFTARFIDRLGKGIRGAPRDALVADITPPELRGAAYGLRQALDSVGAFIGPLLAVLLMLWFSNDIRSVLWVAALPAGLSVVLLMLAVAEPARPGGGPGPRAPVARVRFRALPRRYWYVAAVGAVFTLARFSEAFLVLRAQDVGLAIAYVPAVMIVMNVVYAAAAYPAGLAADRINPRTLLVAGLAVLVCADLLLATAATPLQVFLGTAGWGLHMALTQGLLSKLVAGTASAELRGTAFGLFYLLTGAALLAASLIAGALWSAVGPTATFLAGAVFSTVAAAGLLTLSPPDAPAG
jgi:MFS family permease